MKKTAIFTLALTTLLSFFSCNKNEGNKAYYIGTNNDKLSDGSKHNPWKSSDDINYSLIKAGDTIYLMNGGFSGSINIDSLVVGTKDKPVVITSSDNSKAKILSGDNTGLYISNSCNVKIERLHLIGSGRNDGNTKNGLYIDKCNNIFISDIEIEGYQKSGLFMYTPIDVVVDDVNAHDNGFAGIYTVGIYGKKEISRNIIIRNCKAENNPGDPSNTTGHSGSGILMGSCTNVLLEYSTSTNNGWDMPRVGNGPVGIWAFDADSILIQYCISYRNKTSKGSIDGGGYDFDGGVTNSTIQYCLSYENEGSAFGLFEYDGASPWYNNTVRYCISENDGLISTGRSSVYIWNAMNDSSLLRDCYFYNNTIYNEHSTAICYEAASEHTNFYFYNNIFISPDDLIVGNYNSSTFRANCWYSLNNKGFKINNINSLEEWAEKHNKEFFNNNVSGLCVLPDFKKPGITNITDPKELLSYDAFHIPENSQLRTSGLNLNELFGIQTGGKDFNQKNALPDGIGACQ
jgi:hypothetical protein